MIIKTYRENYFPTVRTPKMRMPAGPWSLCSRGLSATSRDSFLQKTVSMSELDPRTFFPASPPGGWLYICVFLAPVAFTRLWSIPSLSLSPCSYFSSSGFPCVYVHVCACFHVCACVQVCISLRCHFLGVFHTIWGLELLMLLCFVVWYFILFFETASLPVAFQVG